MKVQVGAWAWLPRSHLTSDQIDALRAALTVIPRKVGDHPGDPPKPIQLYVESADGLRFGVPRAFFATRRRDVHEVEDYTTVGDTAMWPGPLHFDGTLRPEQERAVALAVAEFQSGCWGGLIKAVPGWGKTVAACALIARMNVPTLVLVHKEFLLDQWMKRIVLGETVKGPKGETFLKPFLPNAKVGLCQQDVCDFEGKHIVIGMIQSLSQKRYPPEFYSWPGLVVVDEVHRVGAATWAPVPTQFSARWRLGVSGTPRRKDGAENVFLYHIGKILYTSQERRLAPLIKRVWTKFRLVRTERFNPALAPKSLLLQFLCASTPRNELIVETLVAALQAGRKVLLLSERLNHLEVLEMMLRRVWPDTSPPLTVGHYIGGMSKTALEEGARAQVIFATSQYAQEGLDIPALDTLFLTTPLSDVEQAVGRILRPHEGKKAPIVVDFRDDDMPSFCRMAEYREAFYLRATAT